MPEAQVRASHVYKGDTLQSVHDGIAPERSADKSGAKMTWWPHKGSTWSLHNLQQDPTELNDLAGTHPQRVKRMQEAFLSWAREVNVLPWPEDR